MFILVSLLSLASSTCDFPNLSVGSFNITTERQLKDIIKKESIFLLGLSSKDCENCCKHEEVYNKFVQESQKYTPKIPLIRHDVQASPFINKYIPDIGPLPQLFGVRKGTFYKYYDLIDSLKILRFADKLISPIFHMNNLTEVLDFLNPPTGGFQSLKFLGLLSDKDLLEDYEKGIRYMANWFASDFRAVTNKDLIKQIRAARPEIPYSNGLILMRVDDTKYLDLELPQDIRKWVLDNSVGLVEELSPFNFQIYAINPLPMVIMFIDPSNEHSPYYLEEYKKSARKFVGSVLFVWLNGTNPEYIEKKRKLGLNTEILPAIAFNSRNFVSHPFVEASEISEKNIDSFVQGYIDGKKSNYEGVYKFNGVTLESCDKVGAEEFDQDIYGEDDVLLILFSSHLSKDSQRSASVFNRVCRRFKELGFPGFKVRAFDAALTRVHRTVDSGKFPAVFLKKGDELVGYEGEMTAMDIMRFVEKGVDRVTLPELPHLDEKEKEELRRTERMKETREEL